MIGRSVRLLQALGAVLANLHKTIRKTGALFAADPIKAFTNGGRDCGSHGFPGSLCELFRQTMRLRVFDVQAHSGIFPPYRLYHSTRFANEPQKVSLRKLFTEFSFCGFAKPHAGAAAVLVDELDASGLQGSANGKVVRCSHGCLTIS